MVQSTKPAPKNVPVAKKDTPDNKPKVALTAAERAERAKAKRIEKAAALVEYPVPEGGLPEIPADFDPKKHRPLKRAAFKNEADYIETIARGYEAKAAKVRAQVTLLRKTGGRKQMVKVNRLKKMQNQMAALRAQLIAEGMELDDVLAPANGEQKPAETKVEATTV